MDLNNLPNNDSSSLAPIEKSKPDEPRMRKVNLKSKPVVAKKPVGSKFKELFISTSADVVKDYIVRDILVPGIKDGIMDVLSLIIYGDARGVGRRPKAGAINNQYKPSVNYSVISKNNQGRSASPAPSGRNRSTDDYCYIFETKEEANDVLNALAEAIDDFGFITLNELRDQVGVSPKTMDTKWGWTDISDAYVARSHGGFALMLPEPEYLGRK